MHVSCDCLGLQIVDGSDGHALLRETLPLGYVYKCTYTNLRSHPHGTLLTSETAR